MSYPEYVVGLDIGTTKICAFVGKRNEHGKIEVIAMGREESLGVRRGVVANIDKTVEAIKSAVQQAREASGLEIDKVFVGIAGQHIRSYQHRGLLVRDSLETEISRKDIVKLIDDMHKIVLDPGERIIHVLPQEFTVDNQEVTKEPVGMSGIRLEANFHIITGQISAAQNLIRCVEKAGLTPESIILEPLASSNAVLCDDELEAGVALVDIGGGTTDLAIFQDGIIRHTAVIPLGGNVITDDITSGLMILRHYAEQLKVRFGSALAMETGENEIVSIPGIRGREAKEVTVRNLAHIIQARMEQIIDLISYEIKTSGFENKLVGGIVLTGGGSQLKHLVQLTQFQTGFDVRVGYANEHLAKSPVPNISNPQYATGIGLIMQGYEHYDQQSLKTPTGEKLVKKNSKSNWLDGLLQNALQWFESDIDR